jgi:uncharacterized hydrophobic protein (TIGR00271 family)
MPEPDRLAQSLLSKLFAWGRLMVSEQRAEQVIGEISFGSTPGLGYYALISAASLIASLGLVANSAAVVIGAMLVSPLMTPIFGMALGMVRGDTPLLARAFRAEFGGVFLAVAFGAVFGALPVVHGVTSEMLSRTVPTLLDLLVAVFAGLAGTLAVLDERISPVLPGVAISTAIVPPLSTCGLCLAMGAFGGAYGAFLLFVANFLAIMLVSSLAFLLTGLAGERGKLPARQLASRLLYTLLGFAVVTVVLTYSLMAMLEKRTRDKVINQVFTEATRKAPVTALVRTLHKEADGTLYVLATVRTPKVIKPNTVRNLQKQIHQKLGIPVHLVVRSALSKDISATGTTSEVVDPSLDGIFISKETAPYVRRLQLSEQTLREMFAQRPELLLMDVDLFHLSGEPVILASVQTPRALLASEISEFEDVIRKRLKDPKLRLLVQCQVPIDVTSRGRILLGSAHFGKQREGAQEVKELVRRGLTAGRRFFVSNIDSVWKKDHWLVRAEVFGDKVISSSRIRMVEQQVGDQVGKPVKIQAWSRAELIVQDDRSMPMDQFTREQLKLRKKQNSKK